MNLKVFKFGGASVKDADHIRHLNKILEKYPDDKLLVVVSAMGKTTNALEEIYNQLYTTDNTLEELLVPVIDHHLAVAKNLEINTDILAQKYAVLVDETENNLTTENLRNKDLVYDQIVSLGELFSTHLIALFLQRERNDVHWLDVRNVLATDRRFRNGKISFSTSQQNVDKHVKPVFDQNSICITQGFIASSQDGLTTTLGREGSDYTAALFAYFLDVEDLSIWKDVPGILTADPKRFENVEKIDKMSYREAIEMTYYGAKVIHPKTIQPIQNKGISLNVNSFKKPDVTGTVISSKGMLSYPPIVVIQDDVALIQISSRDFSFIQEDHLSTIFHMLDEQKIKLLTMRNSAISFTISIKYPGKEKLDKFSKGLQDDFTIESFEGLQLITIRHFTESLIEELTADKLILFEEIHKDTVQMVVRPTLQLTLKS